MSPLALRAGSSNRPLLDGGFREAGISVQPLLEPSQLAQPIYAATPGHVDGQRPGLRDDHFFRRHAGFRASSTSSHRVSRCAAAAGWRAAGGRRPGR